MLDEQVNEQMNEWMIIREKRSIIKNELLNLIFSKAGLDVEKDVQIY